MIAVHRSILKALTGVFLLAPMVAGCGGMSDFSMKDQEWFARPARIFGTRSLSIEAPPLSVASPVSANDLITADGACPGLAPAGSPSNANALQDTDQPGAVPGQSIGSVALGHTECDVARAIGSPDSVNISSNARGDRETTMTYTHGARPGLYTFTAGRLSAVERVDVPEPAKPAKSAKPKKRASTT